MDSSILIGLFAVLLLGGAVYPSFGQFSSIADHVVINEIDINPPGDDSRSVSEWVELYNPTDDEIDLGGWTISSTTVLKNTLTIPQGTILEPGRFLAYSHVKVWFTDVSERVELRDSNGILVDETPEISDLKSDFTSWQRNYDGFDTDLSSDWKFEISNAGSSNGKLAQEEVVEKAQVTVSVDKTNYVFGETAIISGEVSERVFQEIPSFQAAKIKINIWGPSGYNKNIELFPDFFLKYKTELNLQEVLGVKEGVYFVTVQYDEAITSANFSVGDEVIITEEIEESALSITTDKEFYIPGETAKIIASTSEIIPFEGLKFTVLDPNGKQVFDGTLYPTPSGEFSTTIFLTTVNPVYGSYRIQADYSTQSSTNLFEVSEDVKEEKLISLRTDKDVYGIGDTVIITGRLNTLWIDSLDLEILQTGIVALDVGTTKINKVLDAVRLEGDSTFRYDYQIPNNDYSYGGYRVTVTKEIGTETTFFNVVPNPEDFVAAPTKPFSINTDKTIYEAGDTIVFSGKVDQIVSSSQYYTPTIDIVVKSSEGKRIFTEAHKPSSSEPGIILYSLTAVPDIIGNYQVKDTLYRAIYGEGSFVVSASYGDGIFTDSTSFSIIDPLKIEDFANVSLDKEVYGFGEDVHLIGLLPQQSQGVGITITLLKPDGDTDKFGTLVDEGRFSWSWTTPVSEKSTHIKSGDDRSSFATNLGIYRITVGTDTGSTDLFFKVSENPAQDSLVVGALSVTTDKPVYNAGEKLKVSGMAIKRAQGTEGLVVPERAHIVISKGDFPFEEIYDASVYLGPGGDFQTLFEMPVTIFKDGTYKVTATYLKEKAENVFQVSSTFLTEDSDELSLLIILDKAEYYPGDIVKINARPSKPIFPEFIKLGIPSEEQTKINCGAFVCGHGVPISTVRPLPDGTFHYEHTIPDDSIIGTTFVVTFDTEFGTFTKPFTVVEKPPEAEEPKPLADRVIEKFNRIPESFIPITVQEKLVDDNELHPRVIQGSLFAPKRGEEANVNLKVTTQDGTCIIGPAPDCAVSESTRIPGSIYKTIQIDGKDYDVRYSGPNVTLEKFTILPATSGDILPDSTWNVDILKDDQSSRFYYKVTYITTE